MADELMNLRHIEVFRAVMSTGSATDAARLLSVSQPGISRMIRHLELRLGVALFERGRGRLLPTPEAQALHAEIDKVYRGVQRIQDVARGLRSGGQRTLRVLATPSTGLQLVPDAVCALQRAFPAARVSFESLPVREIVPLMAAGDADVALSSAPIDHPLLRVKEIGRWQLACAVPRDEPPPARLADALRRRLVVYGPDAPQTEVIERLLRRHRIVPDIAAEVRSGFAACAMAAAGVGVAFVDDLSARAHGVERLRLLPLPRHPGFGVWAVLPGGQPPARLARELVAAAQATLARFRQSSPFEVPGSPPPQRRSPQRHRSDSPTVYHARNR